MTDYAVSLNSLEKPNVNIERLAYHCTMAISCFSVLYLITVYLTGHSWLSFISVDVASSELRLSLIQCILGAAALHVPILLTKLTRIKLPDTLCACFYLFILCATVLGEMFSLYYKIPIWDSILHFGSGVMIGMFASLLLVEFLKNKKCTKLVSPMFIAIAAVCFALCIGVVWEMYEFAGDSLLGLNMQKCLLEDGSELIGKAALLDTMKDLIVDTLGALCAAASAFLSLKHKKGWLYSYLASAVVRKTQKQKANERGLELDGQMLKYIA